MSSKIFSRRYLFFGVACLGLLMTTIDLSIVAVAIPSLRRSFDTSLGWVGLTLTANQLTQVIAMPLAGKFSDYFGRKRVFVLCTACFTFGSLLCALAPNIALLIIFRIVQAIGAGGLMPSATGIVAVEFKEQRDKAIGLFVTVGAIGAMIGPIMGGWLLEYWTWRAIFFVNVPIGAVVLIGAFLFIKEQRVAQVRHQIDYAGLALFAAAMVALMSAVTVAGNPNELRSPLLWTLVTASMVLFALFVRQEKRCRQPIMDMRLVSRSPFLQTNSYNFIMGISILGSSALIPYFAVVQYHVGAIQSGAVAIPRAFAVVVISILTSFLFVRLGYRIPMMVGMLLLAFGTLLASFGWMHLSLGPIAVDGLWILAISMAISGIGMGFAQPAANNAMIDLMPDQAAAIAGLRGMFRWTGGIMAISVEVLALSWFSDQAAGARTVYFVQGLVLLLAVPMALMIPDTIRQRVKRVVLAASTHQTGQEA